MEKCGSVPLTCTFCNTVVLRSYSEKHQKECLELPVDC